MQGRGLKGLRTLISALLIIAVLLTHLLHSEEWHRYDEKEVEISKSIVKIFRLYNTTPSHYLGPNVRTVILFCKVQN